MARLFRQVATARLSFPIFFARISRDARRNWSASLKRPCLSQSKPRMFRFSLTRAVYHLLKQLGILGFIRPRRRREQQAQRHGQDRQPALGNCVHGVSSEFHNRVWYKLRFRQTITSAQHRTLPDLRPQINPNGVAATWRLRRKHHWTSTAIRGQTIGTFWRFVRRLSTVRNDRIHFLLLLVPLPVPAGSSRQEPKKNQRGGIP